MRKYLSVWIVTGWQCISPEVTVKTSKKCCIAIAVDETDDDTLWNDCEEDGNVRSEMKALNVKMETVTLIGKGS